VPSPNSPTASKRSEQITDRAIERREEDRFGHQDFVDRLLSIIKTTSTPANIALFGRWGSGKTGISNRLAAEIKAFDGIEFAYFDAFKFARLPLLRRFLIGLAHSLGGPEVAEIYRQRVYERKEVSELNISDAVKNMLWRWAKRGVWGLAGVVFALDLILYLMTAEQQTVLVDLVGAAAPVILPSALVGAAAAFFARYLTATRTTENPNSEEQFEGLFSELLEQFEIGPNPDQRKLVVFVDELDRCSAREVAETLDGIKTFLDVPGCIFIVAADQKVLEHALTEQVRQATPRDLTNPYYSAGSAYLDKIFQYQVILPPLLPGRLTDFALQLLTEVGGIWDQVPAVENVVSVLLPVHVRSPRRVKVLLNAFAQAFALAVARAEASRLGHNIPGRAEEIAKLVALQVEFPLFAADLASHRRLPESVLAYAEAEAANDDPEQIELLQGVPEDTRLRVRGFAKGELDTDASLASKPDADDEGMRRAQGSALIDYLRQTALIEGPRTDLVHLEALHLASGIDEGLAVELEDLALKNRPAKVSDLLVSLQDADERNRAILRLGQIVRESKGIDTDNAVRALLAAFPAAGSSSTSLAKGLLAPVLKYDRDRQLASEELPGALELAIQGESWELQRRILVRPEAGSPQLRPFVLDRIASLIEGHASRLGQLMAWEIREAPERAGQRFLS